MTAKWLEHVRHAFEGRRVACTPKAVHHRISTASDTLFRILPLAAAAGITRIADVTGLDRIGVHTAMVARPNSCSLSVFQGKGLDLASAKVSGLMEAIETHHAECLDWPVRLLAWNQIRGTIDRSPRLLPGHQARHSIRQDGCPGRAVRLAEGERVLVPWNSSYGLCQTPAEGLACS